MLKIIEDFRNRFSIRLFLRKAYSLILYYGSFRWIGNIRNLNSLKDSCAGRRMFIVCNGPSLRPEDLTKLHKKEELSFVSNSIDSIFSKTEWRPTFYAIFDELAQYTFLDRMNRIPSKWQFYRKNSYKTTRKTVHPAVFITTDGSKKLLDAPKFSPDCRKGIYTIGTVTYSMIQLSVFLGCKELYIIGCDNRYPVQKTRDGQIVYTDGKAYFDGDDAHGDGRAAVSVWQMDVAYEAARKYADAHGIKIYNATRGGCLEAFPRVDFDSLFEN